LDLLAATSPGRKRKSGASAQRADHGGGARGSLAQLLARKGGGEELQGRRANKEKGGRRDAPSASGGCKARGKVLLERVC
jgi:hypothetical protein